MSAAKNYGSNMKLFTTYWGQNKTFKLMPINNDCPFSEVILDTETGLLVVISKHQHHKFEMLPKLDDDGNMIQSKKQKTNGKPFKEQRVAVILPQEYYITERKEQVEFIKEYAVNHATFKYDTFLKELDKAMKAKESNIVQKQPEGILDAKGNPMQAVK